MLLLLQECHLLRPYILLGNSPGRHHRSYTLLLSSYHHIHLHQHSICSLRICHFHLVDHHHHLLGILRSNHCWIDNWETTSLTRSSGYINYWRSRSLLLVLGLKILLSTWLLWCTLRQHIDIWNLVGSNHILKLLCSRNLIYHHTLIWHLHIWCGLPELRRSDCCLSVWMNMLLWNILWLPWHSWYHSLHRIHHCLISKRL